MINLKKKLFILINILFILICVGIDVFLGFYFKFNHAFYYSTIFFILGIAIGNLILMIIRMLLDNDYKFKKYTPIMHTSYLIIAGIMYYAIEWLKNYDKYFIIYWSVLGGAILIDLIVFIIINNLKKAEDTPKFKVNK